MKDDAYYGTIRETAGRIRASVPADLAGLFAKTCGIRHSDFVACSPAECGEVCAVDGSNVILLESGSMALAVVRAAQTTFLNMERTRRSVTPMTFALIGPGEENQDFPVLYTDCFGHPPGKPLKNEDIARAAGILRDTVEYWVTETMARELGTGALLLRDGPLRVSHESHDPVLTRIAATCRERDIGLAGISKRSAATWGGGHPLLPAVWACAKTLAVKAPWWIKIDPGILDHAAFPQWQHGEMYVSCLHPRAKGPLKIELAKGTGDEIANTIMHRICGCSADGRIPGYPYPLLDAHRTVALTEEIVEQVKGDLLGRLAEAGIDRQTYEILFGDYHDEFARY
ncbi:MULTISPECIES: DNA double-strand break repair nuclease NurA [unclassified Methanoregula]|uniref:DNA double-strand break repair nuclease NurA n=1 Tax=unclassified Methanoregula TaxID=2649730 RepID=UPI0009CAEC14|nr:MULTISPECIES: DNA double-strand break repair nuclease NurA [unclassified Methanoregula]OPX65378.1 MAG: NurA domain protein [Methanoregula sp. PtaB.Bin085]OPY32287.1 MAG: NurA domain protein [Methanoregula sp. PtaU1.Bin006]